jgi:hypothetical protein
LTVPASSRQAFDAFEAAGWEQAADDYDEFIGPITHRLIAPVLNAAGVTTGTRRSTSPAGLATSSPRRLPAAVIRSASTSPTP